MFLMIFMFYEFIIVKQITARHRILVRAKWSIKTSLSRNMQEGPRSYLADRKEDPPAPCPYWGDRKGSDAAANF